MNKQIHHDTQKTLPRLVVGAPSDNPGEKWLFSGARKVLLVGVAWVCWGVLIASQAGAAESCPKALGSELENLVTNHNAHQSAESYRQNNRRQLAEYTRMLGSEFARQLKTLSPRHLYVDSGAGIGVAAREIGITTGARVLMINPQDYSGLFHGLYFLRETAYNKSLTPQRSLLIWKQDSRYPEGLTTQDGLTVDIKGLELGLQLLGRELPESLKFRHRPRVLTAEEYQKLFLDLIYRVSRSEELSHLWQLYEVGLSEDVLVKYQNQVQLLTDVYAAFYYSPNRLELLRAYYEALVDGGSAFIFLGAAVGRPTHLYDHHTKSIEAYGGDKVVAFHGQSSSTLIEWLATNYPEIFQLRANEAGSGSVLQIHKIKGVEFPNLGERLKLIGLGFYQYEANGFVVPKLELKDMSQMRDE